VLATPVSFLSMSCAPPSLHTHTYVCIYIYMYVFICILYIYIYIYIYMYIYRSLLSLSLSLWADLDRGVDECVDEDSLEHQHHPVRRRQVLEHRVDHLPTLNLRTTTLQKCGAVPRRARI